MNQLSTSFKALRQTDYEKVGNIVTKPLIRFYPNQGRLKNGKKNTIELSVNPGDVLNDNTFKTEYHTFTHGTVEDLIEWKKTLADIIEKKPLTEASAKFHMARIMLDGAAKEKFNTVATKLCDQSNTATDGTVTEAKGETDETFEFTLKIFVRSHFKPVSDSLLTQREYLLYGLKFPMNKEVKLQEWLARLCTINAKLDAFPKPSGFSGTKYYSEPELKRITLRTFPRSFQIQISKSGKSLDEYTLENLQEYLEVCLEENETSTPERENST